MSGTIVLGTVLLGIVLLGIVPLDTLRLMCKARPTKEQLKEFWQRRESTKPDHEPRCEHYYNPPKDSEVQVRATYRQSSRQTPKPFTHTNSRQDTAQEATEDQFVLEFSFPKLVLGNNYEMIHDLRAAIDVADAKIAQVPAFPRRVASRTRSPH